MKQKQNIMASRCMARAGGHNRNADNMPTGLPMSRANRLPKITSIKKLSINKTAI